MPLALDKANILIRGHFNPYIINPDWLAKHGIVDVREGMQVAFGALTHGLQFQERHSEWQIDFEHLTIGAVTSNDCDKIADYAARVLEKLPHTPVRAVGNNFQYVCDVLEWRDGPQPMLAQRGPGDFGPLGMPEQVRWVGVFNWSGVRVELTVAYATEGVAVLFNFHRSNDKFDCESAVAAIRAFGDDRNKTVEMMRTLLHQEVIA